MPLLEDSFSSLQTYSSYGSNDQGAIKLFASARGPPLRRDIFAVHSDARLDSNFI